MERARELNSLNASSPGKVKFAGKWAHRHKIFLGDSKAGGANRRTIFFSTSWFGNGRL